MSGGTFTRCVECLRLVIYGQVCVCGNRTNGQQVTPTSTTTDDERTTR